MLSRLPKVSNDPKRLAYLRLPVKDTFDIILNEYRNKEKTELEIAYIVT